MIDWRTGRDQAAVEIEGQPDAIFDLWVSVVPKDTAAYLKDLIQDSHLNDEQKRRIWKRFEGRIPQQGPAELLSFLPVALSAGSLAASALIESRDLILARFQSQTEKYQLAETVLDLIPGISDLDLKGRIASWLVEIGNRTVLRRVNADRFSDTDIKILHEKFPNDANLKRLIKG